MSKTLCQKLKISERHLRQLILQEREKGLLIMSNSRRGGYYLPANEKEIDDFIRMNERQAMSRLKMTKAARDYKKCMKGQLKFDFEEQNDKGE